MPSRPCHPYLGAPATGAASYRALAPAPPRSLSPYYWSSLLYKPLRQRHPDCQAPASGAASSTSPRAHATLIFMPLLLERPSLQGPCARVTQIFEPLLLEQPPLQALAPSPTRSSSPRNRQPIQGRDGPRGRLFSSEYLIHMSRLS